MDQRSARSPAAVYGTSHPFRRSLALARREPPAAVNEDLKLFAMSFTAFFVCFYTFLL
ncbi:hypothetical protein ACBY01_02445 [Sphingomonas sp. ac-8]|uniref:hypothetical protein n=1 Tax=Sphingomonas sp. ac-8 TaxID=3242977 RepID=UPI003A80AE96